MFGIPRVGNRLMGVVLVGVCAALAASVAVALAVTAGSRRPSPLTGLLPNGRQLSPAGTRVALGNLPTGGAITADGRYLWTVSAGIGNNDVRIVDTVTDRVCQVLPVPGASGGMLSAAEFGHVGVAVGGYRGVGYERRSKPLSGPGSRPRAARGGRRSRSG